MDSPLWRQRYGEGRILTTVIIRTAGGDTMQVTTLGIDLAKRVLQVHGVDKYGKGGLHKRLSRDQLLPFLAIWHVPRRARSLWGAHYRAHAIQQCGHTIQMIAPQFVKPDVHGNTTDSHDAQAISGLEVGGGAAPVQPAGVRRAVACTGGAGTVACLS